MSDELQNLISELEDRGVVCPLPRPWDKLVVVIRSTKKLMAYPIEKGPSVRVENPLILAGWGASDKAKWNRFTYHLAQADQLGILPLIQRFLENLKPKDFLLTEGSYSDVSVWDLEEQGRAEVDTVMMEVLPAVQSLLDSKVPKRQQYDPEQLYSIFTKHGFSSGWAPTLADVSHMETVEALRTIHRTYEKQAKMIDGKRELEHFCEALIDLAIRRRPRG